MRNSGAQMLKILLVDDDDQIREMLRICLESAGHEIVEASDGEQALRLFASVQPELVITDIVMPDREGLSTIMEIRKANRSVKIIAISGGGTILPSGDYLRMACEFGADKVFLKPLDLESLLEAVRELLPA